MQKPVHIVIISKEVCWGQQEYWDAVRQGIQTAEREFGRYLPSSVHIKDGFAKKDSDNNTVIEIFITEKVYHD